MNLDMLVLVKQVPDTARVTGEAMKPDGTVNRGKLPAIFNPDDKTALELALQLRDAHGGTVTALTMGPASASELLRECLYMGADSAALVNDRKFAGADTLATSYVLAQAIRQLGSFSIIFAGRQAIDGDTAQVGPQTAEKLGLPQITAVQEILDLADGEITARRRIDNGTELLRCRLPLLITVIREAAEPRPISVKRMMALKRAKTMVELQHIAREDGQLSADALQEEHRARDLYIPTFTVADLDVDPNRCGLAGSPTKVKKVRSVILSGGDRHNVPPTREGVKELIGRLIEDHLFG